MKRAIAAAMILGLVWLSNRVYEGHASVPDFISAAIVRLADGPTPRTPPAHLLEATIDLADASRAPVDPRFLSVAIDTSLVVGGHWWSATGDVEATGQAPIRPLDLTNVTLARLARELAPAYVRVGGTEADKIVYAVESDSGTRTRPDEIVLTRERWESLVEFVRRAKLDLFFTLNAGPGRRDANRHWESQNAEQLLRYAHVHAQPISVIEFGNEINGYWFNFGIFDQPSGALVAEDLVRLRSLMARYAPESHLVAPGEFYWPRLGSPLATRLDVLRELVGIDRGRNLDAITWHYYPQQSRRCPVATRRATLTGLLEPAALDEVARWSEQIRALRNAFAPALPVWLGETGGAQCGGEPGVSDRYVSSLWWLDQLGLLAQHEQKIVVRQALVGSNYGLLDDATFAPRPDYFASLLHKRLMGQIVLDVRRDQAADPYLRIYAHCSLPGSGQGSPTILAINLHPRESSVLKWPRAAGHRVDVYQVTAPTLDSTVALLNGQPMKLDGGVVVLQPKQVLFDGSYTLPPVSYVFLHADIAVAACASADSAANLN